MTSSTPTTRKASCNLEESGTKTMTIIPVSPSKFARKVTRSKSEDKIIITEHKGDQQSVSSGESNTPRGLD